MTTSLQTSPSARTSHFYSFWEILPLTSGANCRQRQSFYSAFLCARRGRSSVRFARRRDEMAAGVGGEKGLSCDRLAGETEVLRERPHPVPERISAPRVRGPIPARGILQPVQADDGAQRPLPAGV